jgi:hypothetical protein
MQRILVALDGSEHSDKALDLASDIAGKYGAELVLLHVMSDKSRSPTANAIWRRRSMWTISCPASRLLSWIAVIRGSARSACYGTTARSPAGTARQSVIG